MIDHFNLPVSNIENSRTFYEAVLPVYGYSIVAKDHDAVGFGIQSWMFGIVQEKTPIPRIHVAFKAASIQDVNTFYRTALDAGAVCNGAPGYRAQYGPSYYAAFVLDPDGHNVEAVFRGG